MPVFGRVWGFFWENTGVMRVFVFVNEGLGHVGGLGFLIAPVRFLGLFFTMNTRRTRRRTNGIGLVLQGLVRGVSAKCFGNRKTAKGVEGFLRFS